MPTQMNCPHSPDGWCLQCVQNMSNDLNGKINNLVRDLADTDTHVRDIVGKLGVDVVGDTNHVNDIVEITMELEKIINIYKANFAAMDEIASKLDAWATPGGKWEAMSKNLQSIVVPPGIRSVGIAVNIFKGIATYLCSVSESYDGHNKIQLFVAQENDIHKLRQENDILRGIAANIMPCHYCGVDNIAKCPRGFPGCGLVDDMMAAEDCMSGEIMDLRSQLEELKKKSMPTEPTTTEEEEVKPTAAVISDDDFAGETLGPPAGDSCEVGCESCQ